MLTLLMCIPYWILVFAFLKISNKILPIILHYEICLDLMKGPHGFEREITFLNAIIVVYDVSQVSITTYMNLTTIFHTM